MKTQALVVGVTDYPGNTLPGALNDAKYWSALLGATPFSHTVKTLDNPDKSTLLKAFERLIRGSKDGDSLIFTISCHGTRTSVNNMSADGLILPYRGSAGPPQTCVVFDFEIADLFAKSHLGDTTARLTLLFDCCHAAAIGRSPRLLSKFDKGDYEETIRFIPSFDSAEIAEPVAPFYGRYASGSLEPLVLAATDKSGSAYEAKINGEFRGLYSEFFQRELITNYQRTHDKLTLDAYRELHKKHRDQSPSIFGSLRRPNPFLT